jgi:hypothetical protein
MNPRERNTLQLGSVLFLSALAIELQVGGWPVWTALPMSAGYVAWVVAYSEATLQLERRRLSRTAAAVLPELAARPEAAPADEERAS